MMSLKVGDKVMFHNQENAQRIVGCYLTAGKEYEVKSVYYGVGGTGFQIVDDDGDLSTCCFEKCAHLKNNPWTKVEEDRLTESIANLIKSTLDAATDNN